MSNIQRFRHADPKGTMRFPVDSAVVIEVGDMVYLDTDDVKPASSLTYGASLDATQQSFADAFAGIALEASAAGETAEIAVATKGVFEMDCAAATFEPFDVIGPDDNATPDALLDQQVIAAVAAAGGIGWVAKRYGANTTRVLVEIQVAFARYDAIA